MSAHRLLLRLMRLHSLTCVHIAGLVGVAPQTVRAWKCKARRTPRDAVLLAYRLRDLPIPRR